jgi:hypothetical protein
MLQRFGGVKLPGGLEVLDNWWIIGIAGGLYIVEFFADKIPYVDSVWDVVHTFIRVPAGAVVAYAAVSDMDPAITIPATLIGGGMSLAAHGTKATARIAANLSPEPVSNWILSLAEDAIAIVGTFLAVFAPVIIAIVLIVFLMFFFWFFPKIFRAIRRLFRATAAFFRGDSFEEVAKTAG